MAFGVEAGNKEDKAGGIYKTEKAASYEAAFSITSFKLC
jgi:hypothetical protein